MKAFLIRWAITAIGVLVASELVPGIDASTTRSLVVGALLLGIFNAILRPIMMLLTLPLVIITFGLFIVVINAMLLGLVARMLQGFTVSGFWSAVFGSIIISVVSLVLNGLVGTNKKPPTAPPPASSGSRNLPPQPPGGKGPIIDV